MMKREAYNIFLVLGAVWVIVGLIVYPDSSIWPIGFVFLIIGLIGRFGKKKSRE